MQHADRAQFERPNEDFTSCYRRQKTEHKRNTTIGNGSVDPSAEFKYRICQSIGNTRVWNKRGVKHCYFRMTKDFLPGSYDGQPLIAW